MVLALPFLLASQLVHTTGVNWDGVLTNAAASTVLLTFFGGIVVYFVRRGMHDEIERVLEARVLPELVKINMRLDEHDTAIARLQGIAEGRKQAYEEHKVHNGGT